MKIMNARTRVIGRGVSALVIASTMTVWLALAPAVVDARSAAQTRTPVVAAVTTPIATGQRIFIAGHSFNVFICTPLETLAKEAGIAGHTTLGVQFIGNSTPMQHWNQATDEMNIAKAALRTGTVDVFTMSPNATLPEEGLDKFADLAQQANPGVRFLVQQSWAPWDGNAPNFGDRPAGPPPAGRVNRGGTPPTAAPAPQFPQGCPNRTAARQGGAPDRATAAAASADAVATQGNPARATPATQGFQNADRNKATTADIAAWRRNSQGYMDRMRVQLQAINARHHREMAYVVPVADAVGLLREHVIAGKVPGITRQSELFVDAMGHPGPVVSDVASYVWFAALYHRNPLGMTSLDTENTETSKARHRLLQEIAWQAVLGEPMSGVRAARR